MMVPVNVNEASLDILSKTLGCSKGALPFNYLGLPLSLTGTTVADYWPLVSRCERCLVSISSFLSKADRLQLTNFQKLLLSKLINSESIAYYGMAQI
jgi:hypothetical protein